jgi:hypothetical protein
MVLQQIDLELAFEKEDLSVKHLLCENVRFETHFFFHFHANIEEHDCFLIAKCYHLGAMT